MDNKMIVQRVFAFGTAVRERNYAIASIVERALIPLLEHDGPLVDMSHDELLAINGVGPTTAAYIERIIAGEEIEAVVADVRQLPRGQRKRRAVHDSNDCGDWDGSWDNVMRGLEGDPR